MRPFEVGTEFAVCGVAGLIGPGASASVDTARVLGSLHRRGPDSEGTWCEPDGSAILLHRRLAIRDLSPAGAQPMVSASGSHVILYNGELYALDGLRRRLGARRLRGTSDTEILVEACAEWGVDRVLPELIGMFAFALWERMDRRLTLVRDRLGIKPLYWSHRAGRLAFASDLAALNYIDPGPRHLDRDAIIAYLRMNHFPGERTVFSDVRRLRPGELLRFEGDAVERRRWWDGPTELSKADPELAGLDHAALLERLEEALTTSVRDRMVADVPLGSLLSGGIDSTLVTALMVEASDLPIRTFTVGVDDPRFDESGRARSIAKYLGTDHTDVRLSARETLDIVPNLSSMFGEPFADSSAIPTALVYAHIRPHIAVALSGDGGDEVFAGYPHHWRTAALHGRSQVWPAPLRHTLATLAGSTGGVVDSLGIAMRSASLVTASRHLRKAAGVVASRDIGLAYRSVISQWTDPEPMILGGREPSGLFDDPTIRERFPDPVERLQALDLFGTLPDDILTKVDRASMWSSVESRVPLLDHRLLGVALNLPRDLRIQGTTGKIALRRLLARRVPAELWAGPKRGFGVPIDAWLRGPLRGWADDLLSEHRLSMTGVIDPAPVRKAWARHLHGGDEGHRLWGVLMLQSWLDANGRRTP